MRRRPSIKAMNAVITLLEWAVLSDDVSHREIIEQVLHWLKHEREMQIIQNRGKYARRQKQSQVT